jgi:putative oxidoreductase
MQYASDAGKLILRVSLGVLVLLHGIGKIASGVAPILGMMADVGLPPPLGYLVYVGEVLAPLLLIVGFWTRPAALIVAINMIVAVALVHSGQLFQLGKNGNWALELQGIFFFAAIAVALLGAGRFSLGSSTGRFN